MNACSYPECGRPEYGRGLCRKHYDRLRRYGTVELTKPSFHVRFWRRVNKTATCWLWTGSISVYGYGQVGRKGRMLRCHRVSYEEHVGPIAEGMVLDHLCRVRHCVNPAHLEQVTARVNILRGEGRTAVNVRKTECLRGHPLSGGNVGTKRKNGSRFCRTCHRDYQRDRQRKMPAERRELRRAAGEGE